MQLSSILAIIAFTAVGVMASPPKPYPPPPKPTKPAKPTEPVKNEQVNKCSSGSPFCCSPSDIDSSYNCLFSDTSCNTISICCNNFANQDEAKQNCNVGNTFPGGVYFPGYPY